MLGQNLIFLVGGALIKPYVFEAQEEFTDYESVISGISFPCLHISEKGSQNMTCKKNEECTQTTQSGLNSFTRLLF